MVRDITKYVQECLSCQKERPNRKLGFGQEISRPEEVWKRVLIDHITKLSKLKEKDFILIIKDQCNRIIYIKTVKETENAKKV